MFPIHRKHLVFPVLWVLAFVLDGIDRRYFENHGLYDEVLRTPYYWMIGRSTDHGGMVTMAAPNQDNGPRAVEIEQVVGGHDTVAATPFMTTLLLATLARYVLAQLFVILAHWDWFLTQSGLVFRLWKKNAPVVQLEQETDYDGAFIGSAVALLAVKCFTDLGDERGSSRFDVFENDHNRFWISLFLCFGVGHFCVVEPLYYVYHRFLHTRYLYKWYHSHHHASVITEPVSGTSHPVSELIGYLAVFSLPFLVPALLGYFTASLILPYFVFFDTLNLLGHSNFEFQHVARGWKRRSLKTGGSPTYVDDNIDGNAVSHRGCQMFIRWISDPICDLVGYFVYSSSYHSLHHTRGKHNLCLFCPLWDIVGGTVVWPGDEFMCNVRQNAASIGRGSVPCVQQNEAARPYVFPARRCDLDGSSAAVLNHGSPHAEVNGTVAVSNQHISEEFSRLQREPGLDVVFLGHGLQLFSFFSTPWVSPYMASLPRTFRVWMYPFYPLLWLLCGVSQIINWGTLLFDYMSCMVTLGRWRTHAWAMQRFHHVMAIGTDHGSVANVSNGCAYTGGFHAHKPLLHGGVWSIPASIYEFMNLDRGGLFAPWRKAYLNRLIMDAILAADAAGATHIGLGACNKNESLNRGGMAFLKDLDDDLESLASCSKRLSTSLLNGENNGSTKVLPSFIERDRQLLADLRIRIVTGNTLTTGVVLANIEKHFPNRRHMDAGVRTVILSGGTSKIGCALAILLLRRGYRVGLLTQAKERFDKIFDDAVRDDPSLVWSSRFFLVASFERAFAALNDVPHNHVCWVFGKLTPNPVLKRVLLDFPASPVLNFAVPGVDVEYAQRLFQSNSVGDVQGTSHWGRRAVFLPAAGDLFYTQARRTDLTQSVGGVAGSLPACMVACMLHHLEGFDEHEVGPIDPNQVEKWWPLAQKHGFRI